MTVNSAAQFFFAFACEKHPYCHHFQKLAFARFVSDFVAQVPAGFGITPIFSGFFLLV